MNNRLAIPAPGDAPAASRPLLAAVEQKLGSVPNLFRLAGSSPVALEALLGLSATTGRMLDLRSRERIAIAVAAANGCDYCLAAHRFLGVQFAKLEPAEVDANRDGRSTDPAAQPLLAFVRKVAQGRGQIADADLAAIRAAGYDDARIVEVLLVVAENFLTNLLNNVARTPVDFPAVQGVAA